MKEILLLQDKYELKIRKYRKLCFRSVNCEKSYAQVVFELTPYDVKNAKQIKISVTQKFHTG